MSRILIAAVVAVLLLNPRVISEQANGKVPVWFAADGHWPGGTWDEFGIKAD